MFVDIPYGSENIKIKIPDSSKILIPNEVNIEDEEKIIKNALENPIDKEPFDKFILNSKKLLIIVNDATKPTPTKKILNYIYPYIEKHPCFKFLVACGTHKPPNEKELEIIFGKYYKIFKNKIEIHNAYDDNSMVKLGKTKNGTEVFINKIVLENENIIVIGSVEPHYFAGYTGGRKSFFPGISSYKTIEMNHKFALSNKACSINLEDNPVHIDFNDAIKLLKNINIFSIQTVLTNDYKIYSIKCGDIIKSFNSAINYANQIYLVPIENKGNIVVTVAPNPMDINLYQSQHALENGSLALERDGILILISKCREGVGNDSFLDLLSKAKNYRDAINLIGDNYKLGIHKSVRILKIKSKFQLFAVTDLDNQIIKNAKFEPFSNIQIAIDEAIKQIKMRKKIPEIIIIPYGNLTIPKIMKNKN